jgi:hypothetical protein
VVRLHIRFATAWAALVFAGQLPTGQSAGGLICLRGGTGQQWWVRVELTLETAREMVAVGSGDIYRTRDDQLVADRGSSGQEALDSLHEVPVLDLVRTAGLHPCPPRRLSEAVLLMPGYLVAEITRRALDLGLRVSYRVVSVSALFDAAPAAHAAYEVNLRAEGEQTLPAFLVDAVERDPFILVCRRAGETVLIRHRLASPLPDSWLVSLSEGETWVLADTPYGCARLRPLTEPQDAISLVRRGSDHELADIDQDVTWAQPGEQPPALTPPELILRAARMTGTPVDAALVDDGDLDCLAALLPGEPLAETAVLIRGRDRHLLTAPGGLLEYLPVGEPLYCVGPGSLYLPLGYRLTPPLPPAARAELFPVNASAAIVLLSGSALRYDLTTRVPVWTLWAGAPPAVDDQVPDSVLADLRDLDPELDLDQAGTADRRAETAQRPARETSQRQALDEPGQEAPSRPKNWRDEAYQAELSGDFVTAAELHLAHDDPLRAARLYERAAEQA